MPAPGPVTDTIAAISTPPGRGGIGIVRLAGRRPRRSPCSWCGCLALSNTPTRVWPMCSTPTAADAKRGDEATRIDEALVTYFRAPRSYTAEDLVEIATHGSPVVLELLLRRALELGARLAEPGEFTQRAFLSGRLDLTQAEAVRDLIEAQTLTQARQAASQMGGALSRRVAPVKQALVELVALLEAGIDFAEDDLEVTPQPGDRAPHRRAHPAARCARSLLCPRPHRARRPDPRHRRPPQRRQELALQPPRRARPRHRHRNSRHHARPRHRAHLHRRHSPRTCRHRRSA